MVTDEQAEKAVDFLRDNATAMGVAKATELYLDEFRKTLKSKLMRSCGEERVADQESFAYSHPEYMTHLEGYRVAVEQAEALRWKMTAAKAKLELYRSQEASRRAALA